MSKSELRMSSALPTRNYFCPNLFLWRIIRCYWLVALNVIFQAGFKTDDLKHLSKCESPSAQCKMMLGSVSSTSHTILLLRSILWYMWYSGKFSLMNQHRSQRVIHFMYIIIHNMLSNDNCCGPSNKEWGSIFSLLALIFTLQRQFSEFFWIKSWYLVQLWLRDKIYQDLCRLIVRLSAE